jgi:hypothetical protein
MTNDSRNYGAPYEWTWRKRIEALVGFLLLALLCAGMVKMGDLYNQMFGEHPRPVTAQEERQFEEESPESAKILKDIYGR